MNNRKVHIIDDELVIRESISAWLSKKYQVSCYASAGEYLNALKKYNSEDQASTCILLDFQMPGMNGVELQNTLKLLKFNYAVIFMSGNAHQSDVIDAWHGGAIDFLLKPFGPTQINAALEKHFSRMAECILFSPNKDDSQTEINIPITKREAQVLLLIGGNCSQLQTAKTLGISVNTVKMYRSFLKDKLDLNTLADVIRYCDKYKKSIEKIANR